MFKYGRWIGLLFLIIGLAAFAPPQQVPLDAISIAVSAGFDGSFRENQWMPVFIRVGNDGPDVEGRLVVRPETSNNAVNNTYSVPISLPEGSRKAVFLYITAHSFATQIRVELINTEGVVVAAEPANLRALQPRDQLSVVVSQSASGTVDLTGVHDGGYSGFQANWLIDNIPDRAAALYAVDRLMFSDVDSGTLSTAQREALLDWVTQGGHLIVTGGPNWRSTAAGVSELLPLLPDNSTTVENLIPIADWVHFLGDRLSQQTVVATGMLQSGATVLVAGADDLPLLTRRTLGAGTIDYLSANPNDLPLRGWGGLTELWLTLATTLNSQPSWSFGITNWESASNSVNVLPGINLLPDILPLCGFLAIYIGLIGPLNYFVLSRVNRREWAWLTIPVFIIVFSVLAWVVGFNLRGNEVTFSRLTVVESWPDADHAQVQQLIGLLSPRRAQYSLAVDNGGFLRPAPNLDQGSGFLGGSVQASIDVRQDDEFRASDFPVDSSFIAAFSATASIESPSIIGQATLFYDENGQQIMRGSVRNDSDMILNNPVILVRGQALHLDEPIEPGDVETFDILLPGEGLPSPAPLAYAPGGFVSTYYRSPSYLNRVGQNIKDILGDALTDRGYFSSYQPIGASVEEQENYRRRLFLYSFMQDPFSSLTGRGNGAYLVGWTDSSPLGIQLEGAAWRTLDTTLYLVHMAVDVTQPTEEVLVSAEQFTWMVPNRMTLTDAAPMEMGLQSGDDVTFRYTPLPTAVLREVSELMVILDQQVDNGRSLPIQLWNWEQGQWEDQHIPNGEQLAIRNPTRFLGPQNAVQIRIVSDAASGTYPRIQDLTIEQRGRF
ncbi:MAG: hypothetical protein K8L97_03885 [Anaerolineae bacterium]|nr:hypothetical protein [Anaerolineae bacterium]